MTGTHMLQSTRTKVGTGAEVQADYAYDETGNVKTRPTLYLSGQELRFTTATAARTCTRYYAYLGNTIGSRTAAGLTWIFSDTQGTANRRRPQRQLDQQRLQVLLLRALLHVLPLRRLGLPGQRTR